MAIQRRVNLESQQRLDCPDLRSVESAVSADFDTLIQSFVTGFGNTYVVNGFAINMAANPIGSAANNIQVVVANSSLFHTTASQSGTFYLVPSGTSNITLNATSNPTQVSGSFVPNANNYVGIDYFRFADTSTNVVKELWDPTSQTEDQTIAPAALVLNYEFVITSTIWASNVLPLYIILTDASNNVVSITDARPLLFRLGSGGINPNPFNIYTWPQGTSENNPTSSSNSTNPFYGGDKAITSLKDLINAIETGFLYLGGGPYWYSFMSGGSSGSLPQLREDVANTVLTSNGTITHSKSTAGLINWSNNLNFRIVGSNLFYEVLSNASGSTVTLSDEEVAYLEITRDVLITPNLVWTNASATVTSVGSVSWTSSVQANDWIKIASDTHAGYYQILSVDSSSQVTLTSNFSGTSTGASGAQSQYAFGTYTLPGQTGTLRDIQIASRDSVPILPNIFWLLLRADDSGAIPRVYVKWLGIDLQQGDSEEVSGPQLQNVLDYIGSPIESATEPQYVSAYNVWDGGGATVYPQITQATCGDATSVASNQYFTIYSSANSREYYVWINKDGTGVDPKPIANAMGLEWTVTTGDSSTQVAASLATALSNTSYKDFTATNTLNVVTITNNSAGTTSSPSNVSVGSFLISVTQAGTGIGNYSFNDGDDLTLGIKRLDITLGELVSSLESPGYDEIVTIVASGATPPTSLNGPVISGTNIQLPPNTREAGSPQEYYTVASGKLEVFLNGQKLILGDDYTEVGSTDAPSEYIQILQDLQVGDELEFTMSIGASGAAGPPGPAGATGPQGPAGFNAAGGPVAISTKNNSYSILTTDCFLAGDCNSGNITFTLPAVSGNTGRIFYIKKIDATANTLTIVGFGGELIDGVASFVLSSQYQSVSVIDNGTSWWIF